VGALRYELFKVLVTEDAEMLAICCPIWATEVVLRIYRGCFLVSKHGNAKLKDARHFARYILENSRTPDAT